MTFLFSPIGRALMIVAALTIWTIYQREQAASGAREACQNAQLQVTVDEITRQLEAAEKALGEAQKQSVVTESELAALEKEYAAARESIPSETRSDSCLIPGPAVERLRNIK